MKKEVPYVLCDACFKRRGGGEEKCCSHGQWPGARCVECGAVRETRDGPTWHCIGYIEVES